MIIYIIRRFFREAWYICESRLEFFKDLFRDIKLLTQKVYLWYLIYKTGKSKNISDDYNVEIMSLVSHNDLILYLCMIKSFLFYTQISLPITVLEDGTFTKTDYRLLHQFIQNLTIISKPQADHLVNKQLKKYKYSLIVRSNKFYMRKKMDMPLLSSHPRIIIMDSDLLFFKSPREIINWIKNKGSKKVLYMKDCFNSFIISDIEAEASLHKKLIPNLNSGLICFSKIYWNMDLIEKFSELIYKKNILSIRPPQLQVIYSLLFSEINTHKRAYLPPTQYLLNENLYPEKNIVCRHYVRFVRHLFYPDAINLFQGML